MADTTTSDNVPVGTFGSVRESAAGDDPDGREFQRLVRYGKDHPARPVGTTLDLEDCQRLCIFNVGDCSTRKAWLELEAILQPELLKQVVKLIRVTHANNRPRFDVWVV